MTEKEFKTLLTRLYALYTTNPDLFNGDTRAYELAQMIEINQSLFLRFYSTELAHAQKTPNATLNLRVLANLTSGVDFLIGVLSQDPPLSHKCTIK